MAKDRHARLLERCTGFLVPPDGSCSEAGPTAMTCLFRGAGKKTSLSRAADLLPSAPLLRNRGLYAEVAWDCDDDAVVRAAWTIQNSHELRLSAFGVSRAASEATSNRVHAVEVFVTADFILHLPSFQQIATSLRRGHRDDIEALAHGTVTECVTGTAHQRLEQRRMDRLYTGLVADIVEIMDPEIAMDGAWIRITDLIKGVIAARHG